MGQTQHKHSDRELLFLSCHPKLPLWHLKAEERPSKSQPETRAASLETRRPMERLPYKISVYRIANKKNHAKHKSNELKRRPNVAQTTLYDAEETTWPGAKVLVPSKWIKTYEAKISTKNCGSFLNPHLTLQWKAQGACRSLGKPAVMC